MADVEYAVWVFNPLTDAEPRVTPLGSSRYWADKRAEKEHAAGVVVKLLYRYTFMPGMPWEDAP